MATQTCRVARCSEPHKRHFCRLCRNRDSNHFTSECPKSVILYHGSRIDVIKPVIVNGLNKSTSGRLGSGIYFVKRLEEAKKISKNRRSGNTGPIIVFKCRVFLGRCTDLGEVECDRWQESFDSAIAKHPPWCGIDYYFQEYCLEDESNCEVVSIYINDHQILKDKYKTFRDAEEYVLRYLRKQQSNESMTPRRQGPGPHLYQPPPGPPVRQTGYLIFQDGYHKIPMALPCLTCPPDAIGIGRWLQ